MDLWTRGADLIAATALRLGALPVPRGARELPDITGVAAAAADVHRVHRAIRALAALDTDLAADLRARAGDVR